MLYIISSAKNRDFRALIRAFEKKKLTENSIIKVTHDTTEAQTESLEQLQKIAEREVSEVLDIYFETLRREGEVTSIHFQTAVDFKSSAAQCVIAIKKGNTNEILFNNCEPILIENIDLFLENEKEVWEIFGEEKIIEWLAEGAQTLVQ